ncbi:hypothetical protein ACTFIU_002022 [Dictyostelium citrinum]
MYSTQLNLDEDLDNDYNINLNSIGEVDNIYYQNQFKSKSSSSPSPLHLQLQHLNNSQQQYNQQQLQQQQIHQQYQQQPQSPFSTPNRRRSIPPTTTTTTTTTTANNIPVGLNYQYESVNSFNNRVESSPTLSSSNHSNISGYSVNPNNLNCTPLYSSTNSFNSSGFSTNTSDYYTPVSSTFNINSSPTNNINIQPQYPSYKNRLSFSGSLSPTNNFNNFNNNNNNNKNNSNNNNNINNNNVLKRSSSKVSLATPTTTSNNKGSIVHSKSTQSFNCYYNQSPQQHSNQQQQQQQYPIYNQSPQSPPPQQHYGSSSTPNPQLILPISPQHIQQQHFRHHQQQLIQSAPPSTRSKIKKAPSFCGYPSRSILLDYFFIMDYTQTNDTSNVVALELSNSNINSVNNERFELFNKLIYIDLNNNFVQFKAFSSIPNLQELYLSNNRICDLEFNNLNSNLKTSCVGFQFLKKLDLSNNQINSSNMIHLMKLQNLVCLNLSSNEIITLPDNMSSFSSLETLYLENCHLSLKNSTLSSLSTIPNLRLLNLNGNQWDRILPIDGIFKSLNEISLCNNFISNLFNIANLYHTSYPLLTRVQLFGNPVADQRIFQTNLDSLISSIQVNKTIQFITTQPPFLLNSNIDPQQKQQQQQQSKRKLPPHKSQSSPSINRSSPIKQLEDLSSDPALFYNYQSSPSQRLHQQRQQQQQQQHQYYDVNDYQDYFNINEGNVIIISNNPTTNELSLSDLTINDN